MPSGLPLRPALDKRRAGPLFRRNEVAGDAPVAQTMGNAMDRDEVDFLIRTVTKTFGTDGVFCG